MSDHTVIAILVGALAALAGVVGYSLGEQRHHRDETAAYIRRLEEHERRLRAHRALIDVIAEDYDPPAETGNRPRRRLPEGWSVIKGGGALVLLAVLSTWLRRHWRQVATSITAAGAGAITAAAVLSHGAPPPNHHAAPGPLPSPYAASAPPSVSPRPAPSRTRRTTPPPVLVPLRGRRSATVPQSSPTPAGPPAPTPAPTPSLSRTRRPKPPASPSPTCVLRISLGRVIVVCI